VQKVVACGLTVIVPGVEIELITLTPRLVLVELPQPLAAFTEITPDAVELDVTTVMVLVVEVPIHPDGSVQI
jgi:hypothetical protein